jgi:hypothetical protein
MRNTNNKLRKNYRVLSELNLEGKSKQPSQNKQGFDFEFFTNILKLKQEIPTIFCMIKAICY